MADVFFKDFVTGLAADTIGGAEKIPLVDTTSFHCTPDLLSTYILANLTASAAITPTTGDAIIVERAGTEGTFDLDATCDYVYDYLYDNGSVLTPILSGDEMLVERAGAKYRIDVDTMVTFVNSENGTLGAQITALGAAVLAGSDEYIVSQGGTAAKVTYTNLAAEINGDFHAYFVALSNIVTPVGADELYISDGGVEKAMTLTVLGTYLEGALNLEDLQWPTVTTTPSLAGDMLLMERAGTITEVDIDTVVTYAATGLQAGVLDFSLLASAAPNGADEFVVDDAGTPKSITLTALETQLWTDFNTYVNALAAVATTTATDLFYCIQGGTAKYVTPVELGAYLTITDGDVIGPISTTENNVPQWDAASKTLKDGLSLVTTVRFDGTEVDTALATEKAVSEAIENYQTLGQYEHLYVDASQMVTCTTNGAAALATNEYGTNDIDMRYFAFDTGATKERVQFKMAMPPSWDRGTIKAKFYWTSATGSTAGDTVEWAIKAGAIGDSDAIDAALGTQQVISDILLANNGTDIQLTPATPAVTVTGSPAVGDMIVFEILRNTDGTDAMPVDAWLFGVAIEYQRTNTVAAW